MAKRNGFTPVGQYPKISLPWTKLRLPWRRVETHGRIDADKIAENFEALRQQIDDQSAYLNRTDFSNAEGTRWATFVIAASDSTELSKRTADYVCGGSGDQAIINAVINLIEARGASVPAGRIVLLEGTYNCSSSITINNLGAREIEIVGMGGEGSSNTIGATKVSCSGGAVFNLAGSAGSLGSTVRIANMHIACGTSGGISATDMQVTVENCLFTGTTGYAFSQGSTTGSPGGTRFSRNYVNVSSPTYAVKLDVGSGTDRPSIVSDNIIKTAGASYGIYCTNNISTIPSYHINDNELLGNGSGGVGIHLHGNSVEQSVITGNRVYSWATGIECAGYRHVVSSNLVHSCTTGISTGSDSQYLGIVGNHVTTCTTGFVLTNSAIRPTIIGNKGSLLTTAYTVAAGVTNAFVGFNDFGGATGTDAGTGTQTPQGLPTGGSTGYVLKKNSGSDYDASWALDPAIDAITAKGDLLVGSATDALSVLGAGRDQTIVQSDSSQTTGRKNGPAIYVQDTDPSLTYTTAVGDIWIDTT